jgi:glycerophosphoryl diester phosphodiesterase
MFSCVAVLVTLFPLAASPGFEFFQPLSPARRCQVMAHRGQRHQVPENSAAAIGHAAADLIEWIEVDVRRSADDRHVLFCDPTLERTTNGKGLVSAHTLAQLQALDAGSWFAARFAGTRIATLAECLALAKGRVNLYLDCKDVKPDRLVAEIRAAQMEPQVVVFGEPALLKQVRGLSRGAIAVMARLDADSLPDSWLDELRPAIVEIPADKVTVEICQRLHERGIQVEVSTLGELDQQAFWKRALECGANYVQTDLPEEFLAFELLCRIDKRPVMFACHRGATRYAPENTAPAFQKAFALGADYVEFDVRTTQDAAPFLLHDARLDRTTNGQGAIAQSHAAALRELDAGSWFSSELAGTRLLDLDSFLELANGKARLYFDAKAIAPEALAAALARHGAVEQTVVFQGPAYLEKLKGLDPAIQVMAPLYRPEQLEKLAGRLKPYAFDVAWEILSPDLIERCHKLGVRVFSDAIGKHDNVQDHLRAIAWGIDLIQTDRPLQVLRAMELYGAAER